MEAYRKSEIAIVREREKAMLEGSIASLGKSYAIELKATNCQTAATLDLSVRSPYRSNKSIAPLPGLSKRFKPSTRVWNYSPKAGTRRQCPCCNVPSSWIPISPWPGLG
jgi:hypothetical protein